MPRQLRVGALAIAVIVAFSGLSLAQHRDDDDDGGYYQSNSRQARQYGYQQGYRDGYAKGKHEGRENDPNDYQSPDWRQATRGYEQWMGSVQAFQSAYRNGYENGFRAGYQSLNRGWVDGDEDRDLAGTTAAATSTTSLTMGTTAISAIEPAIRMESARLAKTRTRISGSIRILVGSMTTAITVTAENMATKTAIRRSTPMAIELATRRVFVGS